MRICNIRATALDNILNILPENTDEIQKSELDLLNKVSSLAVMKKHLYDAMKSESIIAKRSASVF